MNKELINAIRSNNLNRVRELITSESIVNERDIYGNTYLHKCVLYDNTTLIKLFVDSGAYINEENNQGISPLFYAIQIGKISSIEFLVKLGANINQQNKDGDTPLIYATKNDNEKIVKLLIRLGANVNIENNYGNTAYTYAICRPKILQILKEAGAIIKENQMLYLTHLTKLENLSKILEDMKMYTDIDMWYKNLYRIGYTEIYYPWSPSSYNKKYPGIYMTLINNELVGEQIENLNDKYICMIFCISLLNREDFHYNTKWKYGEISQYTSLKLSEIDNLIKKRCITKENEIVFHHSVSLKYLREIWVNNEENYYKVKDMFEKFSINLPIKITKQYLNEVRICNDPIKKLPSNYCYFPVKNEDYDEDYDEENYEENDEELEFAKKLGKECGLTDIDDIESFETIKNLLKQKIFSDDISIEGIKKYLKSKGVSDDTIENFSESQLNELKGMNLVGLNFLKNYSRFDGGKTKRKKSKSKRKSRTKRIKSRSKRRKSVRKKSKSKRRKSVRK